MKTKKVMVDYVDTVRIPSGGWTAIRYDKEMVIPDKGRPDDFCNACDFDDDYPACLNNCPFDPVEK